MRTARLPAIGRAALFGSIAFVAASMAQAEMTQAQAAEIKVFLTGAARGAWDILAPRFERTTGHKPVMVSALPLDLIAKVNAGEPFDVIVLSLDVEGLIKQGKVEAASRTVLGQIGVGVAVRAGSPKPDFSTVEKFKQSLLDAKSIATSGEGSSGRFVSALIERLGIADQVKPKIKSGGAGRSAQLVAAGEVDFAVSGLPPLIDTPNIEWLGLLPPEINSFVLFTAGLSTTAKEAEAGRALLRFLVSPEAMAVYKTKGLDPPP
jgi:molybdate transport system substrate-binding protein